MKQRTAPGIATEKCLAFFARSERCAALSHGATNLADDTKRILVVSIRASRERATRRNPPAVAVVTFWFQSAHRANTRRDRRCASAIQIVRLSRSRAETQPQLHPALLSLSAMISQYFMNPTL